MEEYKNLTAPSRVQVFRFQSPLYYANKDSFLKSLYKAVGVDPFLELTRRRKAEKKAKESVAKQDASASDKPNGEVSIALVQRELDFHTIVLDCSAIPFMDSAGTVTFKGLVKDYKEVGVTVLVACCNTSVIDALRRGAFFGNDDRDMDIMLFYTIHAAVMHANNRAAVARSTEDSTV